MAIYKSPLTQGAEKKTYDMKYMQWEQYLTAQSNFGDEIQQLQNELYQDKRIIFKLFSTIKNYVGRNTAYIDKEDLEKINAKFVKTRKAIYSTGFMAELKTDEKQKQLGQVPLPTESFLKISDDLDNIFTQLNVDFSIRGINPQVEAFEVQKEEWEKYENKAKRNYFKACNDMFNATNRRSKGRKPAIIRSDM